MNEHRAQCKDCYWNPNNDRGPAANCICPTCEYNHCNHGTCYKYNIQASSITNWCSDYEDWITKLFGRRKGKNVEEPML